MTGLGVRAVEKTTVGQETKMKERTGKRKIGGEEKVKKAVQENSE